MRNSIKFAFKPTEKQSTFILFRLFRHKQEQRFLHLLSCLIYCHPSFQQSISVFQWHPPRRLSKAPVWEKQCCALLINKGTAGMQRGGGEERLSLCYTSVNAIRWKHKNQITLHLYTGINSLISSLKQNPHSSKGEICVSSYKESSFPEDFFFF